MIAPDEMEKLVALAKAATPGPWEMTRNDGDSHVRDSLGNSMMCDMQYYPWAPSEPDMAYIAAANPAVVLSLVREIKVLQRALEISGRYCSIPKLLALAEAQVAKEEQP